MKAVILLLLAPSVYSFINPVVKTDHHHRPDSTTCLFYRHHRNLDMLTGALDRQIQQIYCPLLEYMKQIDDHENDDDDVEELESKIIEAIESSMTHGPIQKWTTNRPLPVNRRNSSSSSSSSKGPKSNSVVTDQEDTTATTTTIVNTEPWLPSHDDPMPWFPRELKP